MSREASSKIRPCAARGWLAACAACALAGVLALLLSRPWRPQAPKEERPALGAYRPNAGPRAGAPAQRGAERAAAGHAEEPLTPELEARLRAAAHVATVPAPTPSGAAPSLPPAGPPSPELEALRHQALTGWQRQAQQLLDGCVARPAAKRRPVALSVAFAPPMAASGPALQELAPMAVSMPPDELRRLWRDTDPDALQGCLDQVRALALSVPAAAKSPAQVLPPATETVLVQL
ncbi:MAG TPA: hypothetical protein VNO30_30265 [Kofleriaceae bacterium]|nr:hypothetical protein [Kofleriaceae bacterium]